MYKHYPQRPKKLTAAFAKSEYGKLLARLPVAEKSAGPDLWIELFADWNALKSYIGSEGSRIHYQYSKNMSNSSAEAADKYFREKVAPSTDSPEHQLTRAFLDSKHRKSLTKRYGGQLVSVYQSYLKPLDPVNTKLRVEAGKLTRDYDKKVAEAIVSVQGKKMTLWKTRPLLESPNAKTRQAAYLAARGWFLKHHAELADIYNKLVKLRDQMGRNVGYHNYTQLAYEIMGRTDYHLAEVSQFRSNVKRYAVPLLKKLLDQQARALGVPSLKPWDTGYNPETTLPLGIAPVKNQLPSAQKVFAKLSPALAKHQKTMLKRGLIDLENRASKQSGAYCTAFSDEEAVIVFCNSTGDADDVRVLTHEMGHAFQGWESQHIESVDLQWGTADLCEIHSMGMEFLCLPLMDEFFNRQDVEKFRKARWSQSVGLLCYVAVVDEFQHWVYAHPKATPQERDKRWVEISDIYLPGIDFKDFEKYRKTRWYMQAHIFDIPFYYIDYALAETVAMQLAMIDADDHKRAMDIYMKLCRLGGTKSFLAATAEVGLVSPFDGKLMSKLMAHAEKQLL